MTTDDTRLAQRQLITWARGKKIKMIQARAAPSRSVSAIT